MADGNEDFLTRALSTEWLEEQFFVWKNVVLLALTIVLFVAVKALFVAPLYFRKKFTDSAALASFTTLDDQLVVVDNKAVAVQFAGFMFAVGLVARGALSTNKAELSDQLVDFLVFTLIGLMLVGLSHVVTDLLVLWKINSVSAVVKDQNLAVAFLVASMHVCTGILISFSITEQSNTSYGEQIGVTCIWWALGHVALIIFAVLYQFATVGYNDLEEIGNKNVAAALGYGLTLIANALMIASPVSKSDSLLAFVFSWGIGSIALVVLRFVLDKAIFPGRSLDAEIRDDQNWGAAIIEGFTTVGFSLIWWSMYRPDLSENCEA